MTTHIESNYIGSWSQKVVEKLGQMPRSTNSALSKYCHPFFGTLNNILITERLRLTRAEYFHPFIADAPQLS